MSSQASGSSPPATGLAVVGAAVAMLGIAVVLSGPIFGPAPGRSPVGSSPSPATSPPSSPPVASSEPTAARESDARWLALARPLVLPALDPDATCPVTGEAKHKDAPDLGPLAGNGPILALGAFDKGRLLYGDENARWNSLALLWVARVGDATDALVRGRRLDGTANGQLDLGFGDRLDPVFEMPLDGADTEPIAPGWIVFHGDIARVRQPGCYAIQVDSARGSDVFVFDAMRSDSAVAELEARDVNDSAITEASCERIAMHDVAPFAHSAIGGGPAYLAWPDAGLPQLSLSAAPNTNGWHQLVILPWYISPHDRGPLVLRSAGSHPMSFGGPGPDRDIQVVPITTDVHAGEAVGWRTFFSEMWVRGPGCHGVQVDTLSGSSAFPVFEVVP